MPNAPDDVMRTADGVPLKISLQRALVRSRIRALLLVVPLLAFIAVAFVLPIGDMLFRSVDNRIVESILPRTAVAIQDWNPNGTELPDEAVFEALTLDIKAGVKARTLGRVARRLNYEKPGMTSLFRKTGRRTKRVAGPPYKERILEIDGRWRDLNTWRLIRREAGALTSGYFLASVDLKTDDRGEVVWQSEERRIYLILFFRTLWMSALITVLCLLLGYPVAYLLATLPLRTSNLLMILVLLPFWTSLLVRTTSWIALLQTEGVLNDVLVFTGLISDDGRLQLIHNQFGTFVAMVHILLPFMILPLYSVMKTIPRP